MNIKLFIWFALIYLSFAYCNRNCSRCDSPYSSYVSNYCYSCIDNYFLYDYKCYSCSQCSTYNSCSKCTSNDSSSSTSSSTQVGNIIGITITIIILMIFLIIIIRWIRAWCCNNESLNQPPQAARSAINLVNQPIVSRVNLVNQPIVSRVQFKHKWVYDSRKFKSSQNCAICLDSNVFLHTHCHHYFHPKCIWEWSTIKQGDCSCPLCKSKDIFPARIFCQNCYKYYYEVDSRTLKAVIGQGKWKVCNNCNQIS